MRRFIRFAKMMGLAAFSLLATIVMSRAACEFETNGVHYSVAVNDSRCVPSGSTGGALAKCRLKPNGEYAIEFGGRCLLPRRPAPQPITRPRPAPTKQPNPPPTRKPVVGNVPSPELTNAERQSGGSKSIAGTW